MGGHLFCFGSGFSARALADLLLPRGWTVSGTARTAETAAALKTHGITPHIWTTGDPLPDAALAGVTHILISIPPDRDGDPVARSLGARLAALESLEWLGYLSTTGVYGDRGGASVDENTAPAPTTDRGRMRLAAELDWLKYPALPVHIFRLAGIYGPGRNPLEQLRKGEARRIVKPGQIFSRIHVADIARCLQASIARPASASGGRIYNLCDDEAAPPQDVIAYAASLLGLQPPPAIPFDEADMSPMARSFYAENKRVRNDRIKTELGITLAYPTYREGLKALLP